MATTTQNLALIKPAGTDKIRIAQINSNMDTIDAKMGPVGSTPLQTQATNAASSISALQSGMAIVCNGNTHAAIASGSYAYVRNHSSLAEGLYQATTAIAANGTLSTSNLTAVSGGGLNAVKQSVNSLNSNMFRYAGALSNTDIDTIKGQSAQGFYSLGAGNTNIPSQCNWGCLLVVYSFGGTHQLAYSANGIFVRSYTGSPLTWTAWKTTLLEAVS